MKRFILFFMLVSAIVFTSCTKKITKTDAEGNKTEFKYPATENATDAANAIVAVETGEFVPDHHTRQTSRREVVVNSKTSQQQSTVLEKIADIRYGKIEFTIYYNGKYFQADYKNTTWQRKEVRTLIALLTGANPETVAKKGKNTVYLESKWPF